MLASRLPTSSTRSLPWHELVLHVWNGTSASFIFRTSEFCVIRTWQTVQSLLAWFLSAWLNFSEYLLVKGESV